MLENEEWEMTREENLTKLAEYVKLRWDRRLTESTSENMSLREGSKVYITPTVFVKHFITKEDFVIINMNEEKLGGKHEPSSEYRMHLRIYEKRKEIRSIFHAHSRFSLLWTVIWEKLPVEILGEAVFSLRKIAYLPYVMAGTNDFADAFEQGLEEGIDIFMLRNHGVTIMGRSIEQAYTRLETLETTAFVATVTSILGKKPHKIPKQEIERLPKLFEYE